VTLCHETISGVEFDSPTRYPPTFHPESRKSLRGRLTTWLEDSIDAVKGAFYVTGPACVGKTVLMQVISDYCNDRGCIDATIFLTHFNRLDDNSRIIATISFQLSQRSQAFMKALAKILGNNSNIFEQSLSLQFQKLIEEPGEVFRPHVFSSSKKPKSLVIILDGLDQCIDPSSQIELIRLIDAYIRKPKAKCPFRWIIAGRLVPRWLEIVSKPNNQYVEMTIDDDEAKEDIKVHVLNSGFRDIRRRFPNSFREDGNGCEKWPTKTQESKLAEEASGYFMVASCMLQFIADETRQDPKGQLVRCLEFLNDSGYRREGNPLSALYSVYQQILSDIRPAVVAATTCILQIIAVKSDDRVFQAQSVAGSLNMDLSILSCALDELRSVLKISPTISQTSTIEFYHTSFAEFLQHRVDSSRIKSLSHLQQVLADCSADGNVNLSESTLGPVIIHSDVRIRHGNTVTYRNDAGRF